jgi:hypothetical protein
MNKIENYNFDKNDWAHFHDVILDVTWNDGKVNLNQKEMEQLFWELPEEMIHLGEIVCGYGMNEIKWVRLFNWL